jgi:hypothetical protein
MLLTGPSPSQTAQTLQEFNMRVLSRENLMRIIASPQFNLYPKERMRHSLSEVAENEFRKHLRIVPYGTSDASLEILGDYTNRRLIYSQAFRIVFQYPDRFKAKAVIDELVARFHAWSLIYAQPVPRSLSVLEGPLTPQLPFYPNRLMMVTTGLVAGMMTGLLSLKIWRRSRAYAVVTLTIPKETKHFLDSRVAAGQFRDMSEYVRELIRADEQRHK